MRGNFWKWPFGAWVFKFHVIVTLQVHGEKTAGSSWNSAQPLPASSLTSCCNCHLVLASSPRRRFIRYIHIEHIIEFAISPTDKHMQSLQCVMLIFSLVAVMGVSCVGHPFFRAPSGSTDSSSIMTILGEKPLCTRMSAPSLSHQHSPVYVCHTHKDTPTHTHTFIYLSGILHTCRCAMCSDVKTSTFACNAQLWQHCQTNKNRVKQEGLCSQSWTLPVGLALQLGCSFFFFFLQY